MLRVMPVPVLRTTICTPGSTPPDESVTTPDMRAVAVCARAEYDAIRNIATKQTTHVKYRFIATFPLCPMIEQEIARRSADASGAAASRKSVWLTQSELKDELCGPGTYKGFLPDTNIRKRQTAAGGRRRIHGPAPKLTELLCLP
jgi:hypothetical protein